MIDEIFVLQRHSNLLRKSGSVDTHLVSFVRLPWCCNTALALSAAWVVTVNSLSTFDTIIVIPHLQLFRICQEFTVIDSSIIHLPRIDHVPVSGCTMVFGPDVLVIISTRWVWLTHNTIQSNLVLYLCMAAAWIWYRGHHYGDRTHESDHSSEVLEPGSIGRHVNQWWTDLL